MRMLLAPVIWHELRLINWPGRAVRADRLQQGSCLAMVIGLVPAASWSARRRRSGGAWISTALPALNGSGWRLQSERRTMRRRRPRRQFRYGQKLRGEHGTGDEDQTCATGDGGIVGF
ncbi:hypothetical protein [Streptomyces sp. NPDC031705]|uniref:hypothetical protein n=1 Tax=Streptomyces sp. NPDC031705 TaxID=3155729 RepID=UPI0033C26A9D